MRQMHLEYLEIVAQGGEPIWDSESKKFIAKADDYQIPTHSAPSQSNIYKEPTDIMSDNDGSELISIDTEDLPF